MKATKYEAEEEAFDNIEMPDIGDFKIENEQRLRRRPRNNNEKLKISPTHQRCREQGEHECNYFANEEKAESGTCCPLDHRDPEHDYEDAPKEWEKITILVDSGATENVTNKNTMKGYKILKNSASESGLTYTTANGKEIPNLGEKVVVVATSDGTNKSIKFQICDVTKCLASVSRIVEAGHRVIFDIPEAGSFIENRRTGERTYLRQERGLYLLDAWVMPCQEAEGGRPFHGQGVQP